MNVTDDCLIVGGGVIGLSLAWELAGEGLRVRLLDRDRPGRATSWAAAGILPPAPLRDGDRPRRQLEGLSHRLQPEWSAALREETGIDNGFRRCGGIYLARDAEGAAALATERAAWQGEGLTCEQLSASALADLEPALAALAPQLQGAALLPAEAQLRTPRHLRALEVACLRRGVQIEPGTAVEDFIVRGGQVATVVAGGREWSAGHVCLTAGCWSGPLAGRLGLRLDLRPVRGQIVLLRTPAPRIARVVNEAARYLVPRGDGRLLVGSTQEEAGFECRTTAEGVAGLLRFASELAPELGDAEVERTWAGLRPATADGEPCLGRLPELSNASIAAGHFRSGIELAPATAVVLSALIRGATPPVDVGPLAPGRSLAR